MKPSFHSLIHILPLFCNCQFNSIPLLPSSYPGRLASRNSTPFFSIELFFITTLNGPRRKQPLYCWKGIFTEPLHSNGNYSTVACVFVCRGNVFTDSLPSNERLFWLRYSGFAIPAFGRYVTIGISSTYSKKLYLCNSRQSIMVSFMMTAMNFRVP
jgi:hypothetical protein